MHLGIDFDGTVTAAAGMQRAYAAKRWGVELDERQVMRAGAVPVLGAERYGAMGEALWGPLTAFTPPQDDALRVLGQLSERHEVTIVTARSDHQAAFARRWLSARGLGMRVREHLARTEDGDLRGARYRPAPGRRHRPVQQRAPRGGHAAGAVRTASRSRPGTARGPARRRGLDLIRRTRAGARWSLDIGGRHPGCSLRTHASQPEHRQRYDRAAGIGGIPPVEAPG